jgi:formate/nitrite transporter FocA (FNT family)
MQAGVFFPISAFIALGLEHSVANMFLIPMGIALGAKVRVASPRLSCRRCDDGGTAVSAAAECSSTRLAPVQVTFAKFLTANLLPVTLGNIVGGALFVATAYSFIFGALGKRAA